MSQIEKKLRTSIMRNAQLKLPYYQQWMFDKPVLVSWEKFVFTSKLQKIFFKLINEFVVNFESYTHLMPISDSAQKVVDIWQKKDGYEIGTYRTDFVLDHQGNYRPIEITCRFAMNGYFVTSILNKHVAEQISERESHLYYFPYDSFPSYFADRLNQNERLFVLRDSEFQNESKIFEPILSDAGIEVVFVTVSDLNANRYAFGGCLIINELTIDEILRLNDEAHCRLATANLMNDFRTVLLVHDKRFFSVINDVALQKNCLLPEEIDICKRVFIPSEIYSTDSNLWRAAKHNKDGWILKHRALGKSQSVYAGAFMTQDEWMALFDKNDIDDYVLQEWIPQSTFSGQIGGTEYHDYVTGTLLFCDDKHFGFAEFRTSSFPVTNKVDNRKCVSLVIKDDKNYSLGDTSDFINIGLFF